MMLHKNSTLALNEWKNVLPDAELHCAVLRTVSVMTCYNFKTPLHPCFSSHVCRVNSLLSLCNMLIGIMHLHSLAEIKLWKHSICSVWTCTQNPCPYFSIFLSAKATSIRMYVSTFGFLFSNGFTEVVVPFFLSYYWKVIDLSYKLLSCKVFTEEDGCCCEKHWQKNFGFGISVI